jgi:hypothetical protein
VETRVGGVPLPSLLFDASARGSRDGIERETVGRRLQRCQRHRQVLRQQAASGRTFGLFDLLRASRGMRMLFESLTAAIPTLAGARHLAFRFLCKRCE